MYRFSQYLDESLDKPVPYRVATFHNMRGDATFVINKHVYSITIMRIATFGTHSYNVNFYKDGSIEMTGTGNEYKVLSTVKAFLKEYLSKYEMASGDLLAFVADINEKSRVKLYKRFTKIIAKEVDGKVSEHTKRDSIVYTITKN